MHLQFCETLPNSPPWGFVPFCSPIRDRWECFFPLALLMVSNFRSFPDLDKQKWLTGVALVCICFYKWSCTFFSCLWFILVFDHLKIWFLKLLALTEALYFYFCEPIYDLCPLKNWVIGHFLLTLVALYILRISSLGDALHIHRSEFVFSVTVFSPPHRILKFLCSWVHWSFLLGLMS